VTKGGNLGGGRKGNACGGERKAEELRLDNHEKHKMVVDRPINSAVDLGGGESLSCRADRMVFNPSDSQLQNGLGLNASQQEKHQAFQNPTPLNRGKEH